MREMLGGRPCWVLAVTLGACAHPPRPVIAGRELYAKLDELADHGQVTLRSTEAKPVVVKFGQVLETEDARESYALDVLVKNCRGEPVDDSGTCLLEELQGQRFRVFEKQVEKVPKGTPENTGLSRGWAIFLVGVGVAVPLTAGLVACDSDDCKALMGVGLGADALAVLLLWLGTSPK